MAHGFEGIWGCAILFGDTDRFSGCLVLGGFLTLLKGELAQGLFLTCSVERGVALLAHD